jgi:hypothetical protein
VVLNTPAATIGAKAIPVGNKNIWDKVSSNFELLIYSSIGSILIYSFLSSAFIISSGNTGVGAKQASHSVAVRAFTSVQTWQVQSFVGITGFSSSITIVPPKMRSMAA